MRDTAVSKNDIPIRLTDERWAHITEEHCELAGMRLEALETLSSPTMILEGHFGELLAVRAIDQGRYMIVVYRECGSDGFIVTSFITSQDRFIRRRKRIWPL